MNYRILGRTGLRVSEIGFGTAPLGIANYMELWDPFSAESEKSSMEALSRALELGYNYFDTASGYGAGRAEKILGKMLKSNHARCFVATKTPCPLGGWESVTSEHIVRETEKSLERLQVDFIDVLQVHGITFSLEDRKAILGTVVPEYQKLRDEGKVRFLGLTNQTSIGADEFILSDAFDVIQIRYNIIYQEPIDTFLDLAVKHGLGITVNRPLTSGIFQKLMRTTNPEIEKLIDLNALCLNFILSDPRIAVTIIGMRRASEVRANDETAAKGKRFDLAEIHDCFIKKEVQK